MVKTGGKLDQQSQTDKAARFPEMLEGGSLLKDAARRLMERMNAKEKAVYRT